VKAENQASRLAGISSFQADNDRSVGGQPGGTSDTRPRQRRTALPDSAVARPASAYRRRISLVPAVPGTREHCLTTPSERNMET
jgi:hypothetical protein